MLKRTEVKTMVTEEGHVVTGEVSFRVLCIQA